MTDRITYEDKIGDMLISLPVDGVFDLNKNVATANREKFITVVKVYIDMRFGAIYGWQIEFSSGYDKLRKVSSAKNVIDEYMSAKKQIVARPNWWLLVLKDRRRRRKHHDKYRFQFKNN